MQTMMLLAAGSSGTDSAADSSEAFGFFGMDVTSISFAETEVSPDDVPMLSETLSAADDGSLPAPFR